MSLQNMNLMRANFALRKLPGRNNEYKIAVKKLLPLIRSSGLIAALAFYKATHSNVYQDISEWLESRKMIESDAIHWLVGQNSQEVLRVTKEAEAFTGWLKRLADSEL
jgi:CRISPR type III-B/RAMP module-associated protein Cmr5